MNAYAGMPEQDMMGQATLGTARITKKDLAHQVVDFIGEQFGYGTVLLILAVGAVVILRKKLLKLIKGGSTDGK